MAAKNTLEIASALTDRRASFGVVDIGSNSVRLVIYDIGDGWPVPVFNDRVFCSLGKGVGETGMLSAEGRASALETIVRFVAIARQIGVNRLEFVATAAMRDAGNGAEFADEIQAATGHRASVISGEEEARLAALGVAYGTPGADGLVGDLGNGSLELVELVNGEVGEMVSLPIGSLRIMSQFGGDLVAARAEVERRLMAIGWLGRIRGRTFYPVGGAWRTLCRIHMEQKKAPIHIIHAYSITGAAGQQFADLLSHLGSQSLSGIENVPSRRLDMVPISSAIFGGVLACANPGNITFSAAGLREGIVLEKVGASSLSADPLMAEARAIALRDGRSGDIGQTFSDWMDPLYPRTRPERDRLRIVAATLSDIGWREHPDYRARQTMLRVLRHPFLAIDHPSRALVAWAIYQRYGGKTDNPDAETVLKMLSNRAQKRAETIGCALRLAHRLSGSSARLLSATSLAVSGGELGLHIPANEVYPPDHRLSGALKSVALAAGLKPGAIVR
ncbi:MAG: Ppx/GppA family phosphatase [Rhodospirillaceae bacterium]